MSFLHIQAQSYQQSTDESSHPLNSKLNFLHIQNIDLKQYKKKWRLLFNTVPSLKELELIYQELLSNKMIDQQKEQILLQCVLISLQPPLNLKLSEEQWTLISELMPTHKTAKEWCELSQQFIHQSAYNNPWSEIEDKMLLDIIISFQKIKKGNKWSKIAKELQERSQAKFIRTPKQCRERWGNKLDPSINRDDWSDAEDLYFLQLLLQHGRKWAELAIRLSPITENKKRTEFSLKHRYKKLIVCQNIEQRLANDCKYAISLDWSNKEVNKLLFKIHQLERKTKQNEMNNYTYHPLNKQTKLNSMTKLIIISGQSKEEIDLSILFNEINLQFFQGLKGNI